VKMQEHVGRSRPLEASMAKCPLCYHSQMIVVPTKKGEYLCAGCKRWVSEPSRR
jgi:hypothetical protein